MFSLPYLYHVPFSLLSLLFHLEDEDSRFFQNAGTYYVTSSTKIITGMFIV